MRDFERVMMPRRDRAVAAAQRLRNGAERRYGATEDDGRALLQPLADVLEELRIAYGISAPTSAAVPTAAKMANDRPLPCDQAPVQIALGALQNAEHKDVARIALALPLSLVKPLLTQLMDRLLEEPAPNKTMTNTTI